MNRDCTICSALLARHDTLTTAERDIVDRHLALCPDCRAEQDGLALLGDACIEVALPLDEFTRRRTIEQIVRDAPKLSDRKTPVRRRRIRWAVFAVAALLLLVAGAWSAISPTAESHPGVTSPAGRAESSGIDILLAGRDAGEGRLRAGDRLRTADSELVFRTTCGISVLLDAHSVATLVRADTGAVDIFLHSGRLLSSASLRRPGQSFSVSTDDARMRVKGTVFAVTAAGGTVLSVLRGSVEAEGTDGGRVMVRADQTTRISDGAMARMTEQERDWMWAGVRVMDLVDAARAGHLDIDSRPSGAEVWVDDALLGRTPLVARIREGQRMLSLRMDGYQRVTEYLEVLDGMSQNRVFVLEGAGPVVVEQKKDGPATVPVNPAALLAAAQKYRIHRQWQKAADAYAEILALAPGSPQAEAALVSLGKLELTRLSRPASALRHFDAYLKRGGALSQEALYGRATAFRALGRTEEEIRVLKAFIAAYPDAIEVDTASRRLAALTTPRHP